MAKLRTVFCAALLACVMIGATSAQADVRIAFQRGYYCWSYVGNALSFSGNFNRNQVLTVAMSGEAFFGYNTATVVKWTPRLIFVNGPNNFSVSDDAGNGYTEVQLPYSGNYRFSFGPRAMEGGQGSVVICAYPPGTEPYRG